MVKEVSDHGLTLCGQLCGGEGFTPYLANRLIA